MKNQNALGVTFLQAKNTRVQLATYAPTLQSDPNQNAVIEMFYALLDNHS